MRLASKGGIGFGEEQAFRWLRLRKRIYQFLRFRSGCDKTVLLVVGCQRSGTSMLHHLFRLDLASVTYDEVSPLSAGDHQEHLLWTDPALVKARITADRAPLVAAKPLVESQNLPFWLDMFPRSRAIWMVRHYADVAASNVKFFPAGNSLDDLAPIVAVDQTDWRAQHMAPEDTETISRLYRPDMPEHDAAALFWYARNSIFFSRGLDQDERVITCDYQDLVTRPAEIMARAYAFLDRPYPGDRIIRDVFAGSVGRGRPIPLDSRVQALCEVMLERMKSTRALVVE